MAPTPTRTPCPNPLFLLWLAEWKRQARDKLNAEPLASTTANVYLTLKRAHASMRDYPYPLATGLDARCVGSIGDVIASRLQKRLELHYRAGQVSASTPESPSSPMPSPGFVGGRRLAAKHPPTRLTQPTLSARPRSSAHSDLKVASAGVTASPDAAQKVGKRGYLPNHRSPQYAILLALREGKQPMTKASIVKNAGKFQLAAPTDALFPGWSRTACLLKKGLIRRDGHLYALTENGAAVTDRLAVRDGEDALKITAPKTATETGLEKDRWAPVTANTGQRETLPSLTHGPDPRARPQDRVSPAVLHVLGSPAASSVFGNPLCPPGLGDVDNGTIVRAPGPGSARSSLAPWLTPSFVAMQVSPSPFQNHTAPVTSTSEQATRSSCPTWRRAPFRSVAPERKSPAADVKNQWTPQVAPSSPCRTSQSTPPVPDPAQKPAVHAADAHLQHTAKTLRGKSPSGRPAEYLPTSHSEGYALLLALLEGRRSGTTMSKTQIVKKAASFCQTGRSSGSWRSMPSLIRSGVVCEDQKKYHLTDVGCAVARKLAEPAAGDLGHATAIAAAPPRPCSSNSVPHTLPSEFEPIALRAGSYDVVCLVDTREVALGRERMYFASELSRRGVRCEQRLLELGDVVWVARHRRTGSELVLDFVVERKRTEDLVVSVISGRFAEQRYRLIESGAGSKFYIVEDSAVRTPHEPNMIYSIMAKLQIRDGLIVKRTTCTDDTVAFIERLTRHLEASLQGRDVLGIPDALLVDRATFLETKRQLARRDPGNTYHVTFGSYQNLNSKNRQLTLGDLFTKFLMCVGGVGLQTARKVAKAYKTPRGLMEAFDAQNTREAKEAMLQHTGRCPAVAGREVGPTLSKKMAEIWTL